MTDRKLFGTNALVKEFTKDLTTVESSKYGWTVKYLDERTGRYWLQYVVDDNGYFVQLMLISPAPTTDELIDLAFTSTYFDEVTAAATRLYMDERPGTPEFRQKVLDRLNLFDFAHLSESEKRRIESIVMASRLNERYNKREIVGKSYEEVLQDVEFFNSIADQAERILGMI